MEDKNQTAWGPALRTGVFILLMVTSLGGCGPSQQEQWAARMQSLQWQLDTAYTEWQADTARRRFRTNAEAMGGLEARYQEIYARWFLRPDPFSQAMFSLAVALATRVDRGELGAEEANRLYGGLLTDLDRERRELAREHPATIAERDARMLERWRAYWMAHQQIYAVPPERAVRCAADSDADRGISVRCD